MSTRAMVFIDGTWLAVTTNRLADQHGIFGRTGGPLDFGAVPRVCAQEIAAQMALSAGIDVVRTHYFGSIATNYDLQDQDAVQRRSEFFDSLRRHHRYEVYRYETDYRGHRVRRTPGDDGYTPPEKAVDVGLATTLLEMAAVSAYDIAIVVCGDRDFVPALQAVRRLGKRVALVSARGSCARELSDPNDPMRLRDFDVLWLDQLWPQVVSPAARPVARVGSEESGPAGETFVESKSESKSESPSAETPRTESLAAESPYADDGASFRAESGMANSLTANVVPETVSGPVVEGTVTKVHAHGYGFVRGDDGNDYYFRRADFSDVGAFARLERFRSRVSFRISEPSRNGQAGRAATLTIVGITENPVTAPRPFVARDAGYRDPFVREGAAYRESYTPVSSPAVTAESAGDLWADDPFAAPKRRPEPVSSTPVPRDGLAAASALEPDPTPDVVAVENAALPGAGAETEPLAAVEAAPEPASIEPPVKKRRTTRKSVEA